ASRIETACALRWKTPRSRARRARTRALKPSQSQRGVSCMCRSPEGSAVGVGGAETPRHEGFVSWWSRRSSRSPGGRERERRRLRVDDRQPRNVPQVSETSGWLLPTVLSAATNPRRSHSVCRLSEQIPGPAHSLRVKTAWKRKSAESTTDDRERSGDHLEIDRLAGFQIG